MKSKFLSLNWHDLKKGLLIAVLTPVLVELQSVLSTGSISVSVAQLGAIAASGLVAYLLKNLFEGDDNVPTVSAKVATTDDEVIEEVIIEDEEVDGEDTGFVGSRPTDRERNKKRK
jgi:hypothetical protein